ncbi:MAG: hypothetical protein D6714_13935 [Bacteroidetes bacterium]|nr:MAG: hypothetical protein D6714_13935 [Bacteroidota bacterium]
MGFFFTQTTHYQQIALNKPNEIRHTRRFLGEKMIGSVSLSANHRFNLSETLPARVSGNENQGRISFRRKSIYPSNVA